MGQPGAGAPVSIDLRPFIGQNSATESALAPTPEQEAREVIDAALLAAGWVIQDVKDLNLDAGVGVAVREFPLAPGHGHADYLLYVGGKAAGIVEAKKAGVALTGVEVQAEKYVIDDDYGRVEPDDRALVSLRTLYWPVLDRQLLG